jgi:hypothetical protein
MRAGVGSSRAAVWRARVSAGGVGRPVWGLLDVPAAWRLRHAWVGGMAHRGSGVDRGPGWRSGRCVADGGSVGSSGRRAGCLRCSCPCRRARPEGQYNRSFDSVSGGEACRQRGAQETGRGARRGASERRLSATSSDMQRLKLLVEPHPAIFCLKRNLYGMQEVRGFGPPKLHSIFEDVGGPVADGVGDVLGAIVRTWGWEPRRPSGDRRLGRRCCRTRW